MTAGGTGFHYGAGAPYTIAAKTGTAQVFSLKAGEKYDKNKVPEWLRDNKLFIAYAPADNPKIAVAVVAENSLVMAGDIASKMMDYYLVPEKRVSNIEGAPKAGEAQKPGEALKVGEIPKPGEVPKPEQARKPTEMSEPAE